MYLPPLQFNFFTFLVISNSLVASKQVTPQTLRFLEAQWNGIVFFELQVHGDVILYIHLPWLRNSWVNLEQITFWLLWSCKRRYGSYLIINYQKKRLTILQNVNIITRVIFSAICSPKNFHQNCNLVICNLVIWCSHHIVAMAAIRWLHQNQFALLVLGICCKDMRITS